MAWREHHLDVRLADGEVFVIGEEPIPLGAIGPKSVRQVVEPLPELLHLDHLFADGGGHARPVLEITRRREVVGMRVRVEDPLQGEALARDVCQQSSAE
jgi:hypothetical protein